MTAEVALLNRAAVALAADSAVTITYWEGGQRRERFFKGANKIFNISDQYPVGMMIYDSGALEGMPWEVIAKAYREQRPTSHNNLVDYAEDFFDFIETEGHLFPREYQEKQLIARVADSFLRVSFVVLQSEKEAETPQEKKEKIRRNFASFWDAIQHDEFIEGVDQGHIDLHVKPF
jgi:hypothetical protein